MNATTERRRTIIDAFRRHFPGEPAVWARAPGRVDLMGSHTDYNLGCVLALPIDRDTWIAARPRTDGAVALHSLNLDNTATFPLAAAATRPPGQPASWSDYVRGVAAVLAADGKKLTGFDGVVHTTVPLAGGLSSSAALECAAATAFEALGGWTLEPVQKALLCQKAENVHVGVNCGILDQYTSCLGRAGCALLLDCRDLTSQPVRLADGLRVVVCDTRAARQLTGSEYGTRRAQCEQGARLLGARALREVPLAQFESHAAALPPVVARRCRFILEEHARVIALADALSAGDRAAIRTLTADSFKGARDLYEIGAPAMDAMMAAMLAAPGVIGARQAGAGFGGCLVAFVEEGRVDDFRPAVTDVYTRTTGTRPEVFAVRPAPGAGPVKV